MLGLSRRKVYELAASRSVACYRFGSALRFCMSDVEAYKSSCRVEAAHGQPLRTTSIGRFVRVPDGPSQLLKTFERMGIKVRK